MPRPPRQLADGACYHVLCRGNNRAAGCYADVDRHRYGHWLLAFTQEHAVAVYHYCWIRKVPVPYLEESLNAPTPAPAR